MPLPAAAETTMMRVRRLLTPVLRLALREIGALSALLIVVLGLWAFLNIADEVHEGELDRLDQTILLALRSAGDPATPLGPDWLKIAALDTTSLGSITVLLIVAVLAFGYLMLLRNYAPAVLILASVLGGIALSTVLKEGFARTRPDLVPHLVDVHTASFPSGHAMLSAVTYLTLGVLLVRVQRRRAAKIYLLGCAIALTVLIGASRVYLGVHWPTDVLAGWCVGAAWAVFCWIVSELLERYRGWRTRG